MHLDYKQTTNSFTHEWATAKSVVVRSKNIATFILNARFDTDQHRNNTRYQNLLHFVIYFHEADIFVFITTETKTFQIVSFEYTLHIHPMKNH